MRHIRELRKRVVLLPTSYKEAKEAMEVRTKRRKAVSVGSEIPTFLRTRKGSNAAYKKVASSTK